MAYAVDQITFLQKLVFCVHVCTGVHVQVCAHVGSRAWYRNEDERIKGLEGFNTWTKEAAQKV